MDFSPDGRLLAGVCYQNTAPVWEAQSGKLLFELLKAPEHLVATSFQPGWEDAGNRRVFGKDRFI